MKKFFLAVIALLMTAGLSAQFYIYLSDGNVLKADSISLVAPAEPVEPEYVQPIRVDDNSLADWDNIPQDKIASATCPADAALLGLKSVKVYADKYFIFIQLEPDMEVVTDLEWVPLHVMLNTDNSDLSGGYGDEFLDANTNILLEGGVFADGEPLNYNPAVYKWWGEVGGDGWDWVDPSIEHTSDDCWGALVCEGLLLGASSQFVGGKIEIQLLREAIPADWNEDEFGIGFDIQQSWVSVGVLPQNPFTEGDQWIGKAHKLQVKIDK